MSNNMTLTDTAIQACIVLSNAIDSLAEDYEEQRVDFVLETRADLCAAYAALCETLSRELKVDAHRKIQELISGEILVRRTILTAQTGIRFPDASER